MILSKVNSSILQVLYVALYSSWWVHKKIIIIYYIIYDQEITEINQNPNTNWIYFLGYYGGERSPIKLHGWWWDWEKCKKEVKVRNRLILIGTVSDTNNQQMCFAKPNMTRKEGNVLFNDALNTVYLRLYGVRHMVKDHSDRREETCCRHMGYSFRLAARVLLYAPSHRQDNTYHSLCYTSCGALAGMRNSSMGPPHEGSIRRPIAPWANALTTELHLTP